jgi:2-hydroxy-3-oxopropionate reductase
MTEKVGLIGPGLMGQPMGLNLIKAGYPLWVYSRTAERTQPLADAGATVCATPREVAEQADIIISIVSDTPDVEAVILGEEGAIHGLSRGKVLVDMSTISASATRKIAGQLAEQGVEMLDAPVSGGDIGAKAGTLSIMVGGKQEVFDRVLPLFEVMGKSIVLVGDVGAGQVAKSCNQMLVAQHVNAAAEALLLAKKCGADPRKVREALLGGFAASRVLEVHGMRMLDRDFEPGFKMKLHKKDMRIVMEIIDELSMDLPATKLATDGIDQGVEDGLGEADTTSVIKVIEKKNDVSLG